MTTIADLSDEPKYAIKVVSSHTGVRAVTIRAWERRYHFLQPQRSDNHYRKYSEQDIAVLQWAKIRVDSGVAISTVAGELIALRRKGMWPDLVPGFQPLQAPQEHKTPSQYSAELYDALLHRNETEAESILHSAQISLDVWAVCQQIVAPCLVEIGEAWHRNELSISTEHFASTFLRNKVSGYFLSYPGRRGAPSIITGCAPTERHEIGILILSVFLRMQGYRVEFLGADVPLDDLVEYAVDERPAMICLSATVDASAAKLVGFQDKLEKLKSRPLFAYGGQAFIRSSEWRQKVKGLYMGDDADEACRQISHTLESRVSA